VWFKSWIKNFEKFLSKSLKKNERKGIKKKEKNQSDHPNPFLAQPTFFNHAAQKPAGPSYPASPPSLSLSLARR
jgi:hypothetical protein